MGSFYGQEFYGSSTRKLELSKLCARKNHICFYLLLKCKTKTTEKRHFSFR